MCFFFLPRCCFAPIALVSPANSNILWIDLDGLWWYDSTYFDCLLWALLFRSPTCTSLKKKRAVRARMTSCPLEKKGLKEPVTSMYLFKYPHICYHMFQQIAPFFQARSALIAPQAAPVCFLDPARTLPPKVIRTISLWFLCLERLTRTTLKTSPKHFHYAVETRKRSCWCGDHILSTNSTNQIRMFRRKASKQWSSSNASVAASLLLCSRFGMACNTSKALLLQQPNSQQAHRWWVLGSLDSNWSPSEQVASCVCVCVSRIPGYLQMDLQWATWWFKRDPFCF